MVATKTDQKLGESWLIAAGAGFPGYKSNKAKEIARSIKDGEFCPDPGRGKVNPHTGYIYISVSRNRADESDYAIEIRKAGKAKEVLSSLNRDGPKELVSKLKELNPNQELIRLVVSPEDASGLERLGEFREDQRKEGAKRLAQRVTDPELEIASGVLSTEYDFEPQEEYSLN